MHGANWTREAIQRKLSPVFNTISGYRRSSSGCNKVVSSTVGIVESFQEVDLCAPSFSDVIVNGEDSEPTASLKSEEREEKSESKKNGKSAAMVCLCIVSSYTCVSLDLLAHSTNYKLAAILAVAVNTFYELMIIYIKGRAS